MLNTFASWYHSVAGLEELMNTINVPFPRSILPVCKHLFHPTALQQCAEEITSLQHDHHLVERLDHGILVGGVDMASLPFAEPKN